MACSKRRCACGLEAFTAWCTVPKPLAIQTAEVDEEAARLCCCAAARKARVETISSSSAMRRIDGTEPDARDYNLQVPRNGIIGRWHAFRERKFSGSASKGLEGARRRKKSGASLVSVLVQLDAAFDRQVVLHFHAVFCKRRRRSLLVR
jgi:hypothetical protein